MTNLENLPEEWFDWSSMKKDAYVAEKVFGKEVVWIPILEAYGPDPEDPDGGFDTMIPISQKVAVETLEDGSLAYWDPVASGREYTLNLVPEYTTDIGTAWKVLMQVTKQGWNYTITEWGVVLTKDELWVSVDTRDLPKQLTSPRDPIPTCICMVALEVSSRYTQK